MQPGCELFFDEPGVGFFNIPTYIGDVINSLGCSHHRSFLLYLSALNSTCQSVAYECDSYKSFANVYYFNVYVQVIYAYFPNL